jgi:hypothetical protein
MKERKAARAEEKRQKLTLVKNARPSEKGSKVGSNPGGKQMGQKGGARQGATSQET